MGAPIDLTGQRFGRLRALHVAPGVSPRKWVCTCDCGKETLVTAKDLRSGNTKSCGCLVHDFEDLTGQTFGLLTARERVGVEKGLSMWRCECECGGETIVRSASLKDGNTRSCGCLSATVPRKPSDAIASTRLSSLSSAPTRQNTSGVRGVSWNKRKGRWEAYIKFQGKQTRLGLFKTLEEAAEARREAEQELFDPMLEEHGLEPTSEEEYEARLRRALNK